MNENNNFLSRVLDDGGGFGLGRDFGFGKDEIMVEIVGTNVFVDGVVGNEMNGNGGVGGDFVQGEVGVEDYEVTEDFVFLENGGGGTRDEVTGSGEMCCGNGGGLGGLDEGTGSGEMYCGNASGLDGCCDGLDGLDVLRGSGVCCGNVDGLERRDEVLGNDDMDCALRTPSAHECSSGMRDEVMGGDMCCGNGEALERRDEVLGSGYMVCALSTLSAHECSGLCDEVTGGDMCCGNAGDLAGSDICYGNGDGDGLERRDEVLGSGDMGCALRTPSAHECCGFRDEGFSSESEVSAGDSVASGKMEVVAEKINCRFDDDAVEQMVENSDVLVSRFGFFGDDSSNANAESEFRSYSVIAKAEEILEQVFVEVKESAVNGKDQVVHSIVVDAESPCLETVRSISVKSAYVGTDIGTTCVNAEPVDHQTEAVAGLNEMLNKKEETWKLGPKIIESDVYDGKCLAGEGFVKNNLVTGTSSDHVNVSVDSISSQNPAKLVVDSQVADDVDKVSNKGIETSKGVDFSEGKGDCGESTRTSPDSVSTIEHTQVVAGYNEAVYNKVSIEMTTNDSFLQNPMSEVSEIKAVQCEPKYADARKDCKQALISEMNFEEATDYKGSKADASGVSLSVCGGDNDSVDAILKRTEVLDLKEDPTAGVCCNSGCAKEVVNRKCDPVAGKNDLPSLEDGSQRQGLVSETEPVTHMKVVMRFGNDVVEEQHDIGIVSKGIVEASLGTISDEKLDSNSKPRLGDGDMNLVKDTNLSGLNSRGSVVNEEKKDDMLKPDVKRRRSLGSEDDENNILNQKFTGEILNEGDSDSAIPHSVSEVTYGSEAVLSSDMLHRDVKAVNYFANDVPSHLPDCNRSSVNLMSDGVTPDKLLHLTFQKGNNEPVLGSLVDHMSALWNEEEKKVKGSLLDGNVTLSYELNCVDSNFQGTEKNNDLQDLECLDASSTDNHTEVSLDQTHILEVNYDEEQVDVSTDQEMKTGFVDKSTSASCFEPAKLLKHIRLLALLPSVGCDGQLQLTTFKAQVAAYSHFSRQCPLPDFHVCYGLLESDANNSRLSDGIQGHDDVAESLTPRKKGRSTSELIGEMPKVDGKEERELDIRDSSVTASACRKRSRKRKAFESLVNSSGKRQVNFAAKVSSSASQEPNKSFKVGECLSQLRLAAQDPVRRYSFLNEITTFFSGFRQFVISQFGEATSQLVPSETDKPVRSGQRSLKRFSSGKQVMVAKEPVVDHMDIRSSDCLLSEADNSIKSGQRSRKRFSRGKQVLVAKEPVVDHMDIKSSDCSPSEADKPIKSGQRSRKRFSSGKQVMVAKEPVVDYMDIRSSDCLPSEADNPIKSGQRSRKRFSSGKQVLVAEEPVVDHMDIRSSDCSPSKADKPVKSGQRSRKRFSSGKQLMVAEEPVVDYMDIRSSDSSPTGLILKFNEGKSVPSELTLNKIFRRFGPLWEHETEIDRESSSAKVVYKRCSDAEVAFSSAGVFNIFGSILVSYELSYSRSAPFKTLPDATGQDQKAAN